MIEHPADAGLAALDLQPRCEIVGRPVTLYSEKTKSVVRRLIKSNGAAIEGDDAMQGFGK